MIPITYAIFFAFYVSLYKATTNTANTDENENFVEKKCYFDRMKTNNIGEIGEFLENPHKQLLRLNKATQARLDEIPAVYFFKRRHGIPERAFPKLSNIDCAEFSRIEQYENPEMSYHALKAIIERETASKELRLAVAEYILIQNQRFFGELEFMSYLSYIFEKCVLEIFIQSNKSEELIKFYEVANSIFSNAVYHIIHSDYAKAFAEIIKSNSNVSTMMVKFFNNISDEATKKIEFSKYAINYGLAKIFDLTESKNSTEIRQLILDTILVMPIDADKQAAYEYLKYLLASFDFSESEDLSDVIELKSRPNDEEILVELALGLDSEDLLNVVKDRFERTRENTPNFLFSAAIGDKSDVIKYLLSLADLNDIKRISYLLINNRSSMSSLVKARISALSIYHPDRAGISYNLTITLIFDVFYAFKIYAKDGSNEFFDVNFEALPEATSLGYPAFFSVVIDKIEVLYYYEAALRNMKVNDEQEFVEFWNKFDSFPLRRRNEIIISVEALKVLKRLNLKEAIEVRTGKKVRLFLDHQKSFAILDEDVDCFVGFVELDVPMLWLQSAENIVQIDRILKLSNRKLIELFNMNSDSFWYGDYFSYFAYRKVFLYWLRSSQKFDILDLNCKVNFLISVVSEDFPVESEGLAEIQIQEFD